MRKLVLYVPFFLVLFFFLFIGKDSGFHWKNALEKLLVLGIIILLIYLIRRFYGAIDKMK